MNAEHDMRRLVNDDELAEITGYTHPSMQCKALQSHGVFFIRRKDGRPRCTWYHINHPVGSAVSMHNSSEPDFSRLDT